MKTVEAAVSNSKTVAALPYAIVAGDFVRTGGMDRANLALANYWAQLGNPVHLVAHRADADLLARPNVKFHRVRKPLNANLLGGPLMDWAGRRVAKEILAAGGRVVVNGGNCVVGDINWVHYVHAAYQPRVACSLPRRLKNLIAHQLFLRTEARNLKNARLVIANSNRTRQDLIDCVGVDSDRIRTIYYGIDGDRFRTPSEQERTELRRRFQWSADRPVVMFIGALGDRRKGFDTLFAAWVELCKNPGWDADLVVVGQGAEVPAWERRAANAKIAPRVRFLGFRKDVPDLLRAADVLVAPARYEAYGLNVQEALCCGLPAIVSADAGIAERYPAELRSLLLPNCEDANDLANRLLAWHANSARLGEVTRAFGDQLRQRSWDQCAKEITEAVS